MATLLGLWALLIGAFFFESAASISIRQTAPVVHSRAGIFEGRFLPEFDQDLFLGIKYAAEPVRFTPSKVKADAPETLFNVTQYGLDCPAYGSDTTTLVNDGFTTLGEDCLNLNIIRPSGQTQKMPVIVWIYGGGWQQGATSDPRYNMSYIVQQSTFINKPFIGVSINYRTAIFGFLYSKEVEAVGAQNLGLRDQRVALKWVQRHVADFGGDPTKVTIWGESAGAYSVGDHLNAYDGDNEGLFRAAIMESGGSVGPPANGTDWYQPLYDRLVGRANCTGASDTLQCLREVPFDQLYAVGFEGLEWFHVIDGSFVPRFGQLSLTEGKFAKVPIISGTNTDEGFGVNGVNTDADALAQLISSERWVLTVPEAERILDLYPNDPALGSPYGWGNMTWPQFGLQWKRYNSMATDLTMFAPRRLLTQSMSKYQSRVFAYRWDAPPPNTTTVIGVQHFAEIPFVFANPVQNITPIGNNTANLNLAHLIQRMYASFVSDLDPNGHGVPGIAEWPSYATSASNFVFRTDTSYIEEDVDRIPGVEYINSIVR